MGLLGLLADGGGGGGGEIKGMEPLVITVKTRGLIYSCFVPEPILYTCTYVEHSANLVTKNTILVSYCIHRYSPSHCIKIFYVNIAFCVLKNPVLFFCFFSGCGYGELDFFWV